MTTSSPLEDESNQSGPKIRFEILSLFPPLLSGPFSESILKRAQLSGIIEIRIHDIRDWATDKHRTVDDTPYGGGAGMVMMAPPVVYAAESAIGDRSDRKKVIIMSPAGRLFTQEMANQWSTLDSLMLICGRYEGIDDRAREILDAEEISIGDYVLTGGELPAAVIVDAIARLVPGVITVESIERESHSDSLVEYPHYTRPPEFRGFGIPEVLLSGHHAQIDAWRRGQAIKRTAERRPDLLANAELTPSERDQLAQDNNESDTPSKNAK